MFRRIKEFIQGSWQKIAMTAMLGTALFFGSGRAVQASAPVVPQVPAQPPTEQTDATKSLADRSITAPDIQAEQDADWKKAHDAVFSRYRGTAIPADAPFPVPGRQQNVQKSSSATIAPQPKRDNAPEAPAPTLTKPENPAPVQSLTSPPPPLPPKAIVNEKKESISTNHQAATLGTTPIVAQNDAPQDDAIVIVPEKIAAPNITMKPVGDAGVLGNEYIITSTALNGSIQSKNGRELGRLENYRSNIPLVLGNTYDQGQVLRQSPHVRMPFDEKPDHPPQGFVFSTALFEKKGTAKDPVAGMMTMGSQSNPNAGNVSFQVYRKQLESYRAATNKGIIEPEKLLSRLQKIGADNAYEMLSIMARHSLINTEKLQQSMLQLPPEHLRTLMPQGTAFDKSYTEKWLALKRTDASNSAAFIHTLHQHYDAEKIATFVQRPQQQDYATGVLQRQMTLPGHLRAIMDDIEAAETQHAIQIVQQQRGTSR